MQESEKDRILNDNERLEVIHALEAVLSTDKFEAAPQMSAFLRYVVEQAADGNQNRIKAFTVAVDALGKPDSFDPQNDPVVRVLAGRLRAALAAYNDENSDALIVITMTPGSYVPSFQRQSIEHGKAEATDPFSVDISAQRTEQEPKTGHTVATTVKPATNDMSANNAVQLIEEQEPPYVAKPETSAAIGKSAKSPSSVFAFVSHAINNAPRFAIAAGVLAVVVVGVMLNNAERGSEPGILAASPTDDLSNNLSTRARPSEPTVFISAINYGNELENSLNTLVSGVVSESEHVRVYRILDTERDIRFWPEDYILTLTAIDVPNETHVNMQLLEARTGRFVHAEIAILDKQAANQLTLVELSRITDTARSLVDIEGPLIADFSSRYDSRLSKPQRAYR